MSDRWTVVIPVKGTSGAKSRLGASFELAMAIALDTVAVAVGVARVIVVTPSAVAARFEQVGASVVIDPGNGLPGAIEVGLAAASVGQGEKGGPVAVMLGDLPALAADELREVFVMAESFPLAFVADAEGIGSSIILAHSAASHRPAFGADSRTAHVRAGYVELPIPPASGLRRDVDTAEQLASLPPERLGPRTRALLA
ncbi:2-phospho-L-lactate guanylyltransferase [soil metagenome]